MKSWQTENSILSSMPNGYSNRSCSRSKQRWTRSRSRRAAPTPPWYVGGWSPKNQPIRQEAKAPTKGHRTVSPTCPANRGSRRGPHDGKSLGTVGGELFAGWDLTVGLMEEQDRNSSPPRATEEHQNCTTTARRDPHSNPVSCNASYWLLWHGAE